MSPILKFLIGLAAIMLLGWLSHGPGGNGAALIGRLQAEASRQVASAEVPGVSVAMGRDPLSRTATLSGPANDLQREGLGGQKGLNDLVREVDGVAGIRWADGTDGGGLPLLVETLAALIAAYLIGVGLGRLLFGRRREGYA